MTLAFGIERVRLNRVSPTLGFADVRLAAVNLMGLRVEMTASGKLKIIAPERRDEQGRTWPIYALQSGWHEAVCQGAPFPAPGSG